MSVVRVQSPTPSLEEELREQGPTSDEEENEGSSNSNSDLDGSATDSEDDDDDDDNDTDDKDDDDDEEVDSAGKAATNNNKGGGGGGGNKRKKNRKQRERPPHVRLTVEQYLAPDQAKLFAAEILRELFNQSVLLFSLLMFLKISPPQLRVRWNEFRPVAGRGLRLPAVCRAQRPLLHAIDVAQEAAAAAAAETRNPGQGFNHHRPWNQWRG